jgi:hypothetical protein
MSHLPSKFHIMRANRRVLQCAAWRHEVVEAGWDELETPDIVEAEVERIKVEWSRRYDKSESVPWYLIPFRWAFR